MARESKPLKLIPVDEESMEPTPVVRIDNAETERMVYDPSPVRLVSADIAEESSSERLALPTKEDIELRTHQPGIEALIEQDSVNLDLIEQAWGEDTVQRKPVPWGWFALIGAAIMWGAIWSLTRVEKAEKLADQLRTETQSVLVDDDNEEREASELIERIEDTLRDVFLATSFESLARLVRQPERVTPLMKSYHGDRPVFPSSIKSISTLQPLTLDRRGNFWIASVQMDDGSKRSMIVEIGDDGTPYVDWETLVCYQPMKWDEFATKRPAGTSMDFRVYVQQDTLYSHEFSNSDLWVCFRLTALDSEETVFGYAHAGSAVAAELAEFGANNGGRNTTPILRLVIPEGLNSPRGVVIEKVVNSRWLYLDPPDSES